MHRARIIRKSAKFKPKFHAKITPSSVDYREKFYFREKAYKFKNDYILIKRGFYE